MKCYVVLIEIERCSVREQYHYSTTRSGRPCKHKLEPPTWMLHHTCSEKPGVAKSYVTQVKKAGRMFNHPACAYRTGNAFVIEMETDHGIRHTDDPQERYEGLEVATQKIGQAADEAKQQAASTIVKPKRKFKQPVKRECRRPECDLNSPHAGPCKVSPGSRF